MMGPRVVLVGAPGSGKTSVGAELARRFGLPHLDTDAMVEQAAGKAVGDVFVEDGEAAFRVWEREAVHAALRQEGAVVSTGGGAVLDAATRAELRGCCVVWLEVGLSAAASRVGLDAPRPLLVVQPRVVWRRLLAEREPFYAEVADHRVATDDVDAAGVAERVAEVLGWSA